MNLSGAINYFENMFDALKQSLGIGLGIADPVMIQPYSGFGTVERFTIRARVLEDDGVKKATKEDSVWQNIKNTYRFLESDELSGVVVEATCVGLTQTAVSDEEGFVTFTFEPKKPIAPGVYPILVAFRILEAPLDFTEGVIVEEAVYITEESARFGVISDIDDTILQSSATNLLEAAKWMFLYNAQTRLPFDGVSNFYQRLVVDNNPIFYVSSSPWNLYPMLIDFMVAQQIPLGPLFLKDYGISKEQFLTSGHSNHKLKQIETVMETYPNLPFILIGDSGQKDPEIYKEVVELYSDRILAVYIRDVSRDQRDDAVNEIALSLLEKHNIEMLLVADSTEAARHAQERGWIK